MFLKVAQELGTVRCGGVVVRNPRRLDVPTFASLDACLRELPVDFVLTATPRPVTPRFIVDAADRGLPVLAETPPAADLTGLRALWSAVGDSGLVQVAEQYPMMPSHAARAALVATGASVRPPRYRSPPPSTTTPLRSSAACSTQAGVRFRSGPPDSALRWSVR